MKHLTLKKSVLIALVLLQCTTIVNSQAASGGDLVAGPADVATGAATDVPAPSSVPVVDPTTSDPPVVVPTTTVAPQPTTEAPPVATTTNNPVVPSKTDEPAATSDPANPTDTTKTTTNNNNNNNNNNRPTSNGGTVDANPTGTTPGNPANSNQATPTNGNNQPNKNNGEEKESNNTAIIAGSVVGGLVGIALIAGLLTWLNRRGGCTSRTRRRDIQEDFDTHDNAYDLNMTENHNMGVVGGAATSGAIHSSDNLPPPTPFQHARRFVPPTSNPTGYMNLTDEEYGYHQQNNTAAYQNQGYQDYNNSDYDYQQQQQQPQQDYTQHDYQQQEYRNEYGQQQQDYIPHHDYVNEYQHEGSTNGGSAAGYQQAYYHTSSNVTSPTLTNAAAAGLNDPYRQQLKPDQIEQKPNAA